MRPGITSERSVALFLLGLLALNPPILAIFSVNALIFGLPVLYLYLFAVWVVLIFLVWLIADQGEEPEASVLEPPGEPATRKRER